VSKLKRRLDRMDKELDEGSRRFVDGVIASEREQRQRRDADGYTVTHYIEPDRRGVVFECYGPRSERAMLRDHPWLNLARVGRRGSKIPRPKG
jgi:hypothetical protein